MANPITVSTVIQAPMAKVWQYWNEPEHITNWCFASEDWCAPAATNDLIVNGKFTTRMEAKDGSAGFDFGGTYSEVTPMESIAYTTDDGRTVRIEFAEIDGGTQVTETFDPESQHAPEFQQSGWQAILDNFKNYVETH